MVKNALAGTLIVCGALALGAGVAGATGSEQGGDQGGADTEWSCTSEHLEFRLEDYHAGDQTLASFNPIIDTGLVVAPPAEGETVSVSATYLANNEYPEDPSRSRASDDQLHESFTISVGGTLLGELTPDLPDSVDEGAATDWFSGDQTGEFWAKDVLGGPVLLVHSSEFGFTEGPNSLQVRLVELTVRRCVEVVVATTTTVPETTTTVEETTTTVPATTTTAAPATAAPTTTLAPTTTVMVLIPVPTTKPPTTTVPHLPETGETSGWIVGAGGASLLAGLGLLRLRKRPALR